MPFCMRQRDTKYEQGDLAIQAMRVFFFLKYL